MKNMALGNQLILGSFLYKSQVGFLKNIFRTRPYLTYKQLAYRKAREDLAKQSYQSTILKKSY